MVNRDPGSASGRSVYQGPWRIDLSERSGVPRIVPLLRLCRASRAALEACRAPRPASIGLVLTDDVELAALNARHLGANEPTDVLSFPLLPPGAYPARIGSGRAGGPTARSGERPRVRPEFVLPPRRRPHLGDVVVSVERAIRQADGGRGGQTGDVRWSPADELLLLVTHGTLHICGWDHVAPADEAAMRALELQLLRQGERR